MFSTEQITRRCLMTLSDGSKIQATITIPKPTKPIFPEQMERKFIEKCQEKYSLICMVIGEAIYLIISKIETI